MLTFHVTQQPLGEKIESQRAQGDQHCVLFVATNKAAAVNNQRVECVSDVKKKREKERKRQSFLNCNQTTATFARSFNKRLQAFCALRVGEAVEAEANEELIKLLLCMC